MKIRTKQHPCNTMPLISAAHDSEVRYPATRAARQLARRWGLSPSVANAIVRANGFGPSEEQ